MATNREKLTKFDHQGEGFELRENEITKEQAYDTYMEGTIDGNIDEVDENGRLVSHEGKNVRQNRK